MKVLGIDPGTGVLRYTFGEPELFDGVDFLVVIIGNIAIHGAKQVTWEFISQPPRDGLMAGGILPAIVGTAALVILMSIVAVPLGVATAIYLHEYTPAGGSSLCVVR